MRFSLATVTAIAAVAFASPVELEERNGCSCSVRKAAVNAELKTIASHSAADAAKIPLNPLATRGFYVTPDEVNPVTVFVNAGVTAAGVRTELVALATALNAGVVNPKVYCNSNGTATSTFIQTDQIALPRVHVLETYTFDSKCRIKDIVGYVHGPLTSVTAGLLDGTPV